MNPDIEAMLVGLRESQAVPTKRGAGRILADSGWSVFPLPDGAKFDAGPGAMSYRQSTADGGTWEAMAEAQMARSECTDVNIALVPGRCVVPLLVVDLDGADAISRFHDDAVAHGHADVGMWLRANTTRPDHGRHVYFASPDGAQFGNSSHRWGGEVRSAVGHVVAPPSTTGLGRYTWVGSVLAEASDWVLDGLRRTEAVTGHGIRRADLGAVVEALSGFEATAYGRAALTGMVEDMRRAVAGDARQGRNAVMVRAVCRVMDLAVERHVPAIEAINVLADVYGDLLAGEPGRNSTAEVIRSVQSWASRQENLDAEVAASRAITEWVAGKGGPAPSVIPRLSEEQESLVRREIAKFPTAEQISRRFRGWTPGQVNK